MELSLIFISLMKYFLWVIVSYQLLFWRVFRHVGYNSFAPHSVLTNYCEFLSDRIRYLVLTTDVSMNFNVKGVDWKELVACNIVYCMMVSAIKLKNLVGEEFAMTTRDS